LKLAGLLAIPLLIYGFVIWVVNALAFNSQAENLSIAFRVLMCLTGACITLAYEKPRLTKEQQYRGVAIRDTERSQEGSN